MKTENEEEFNLPSHTKVLDKNRKGRHVSIYFRAGDLELLDRIAKALNTTRSGAIHEMLESIRKWRKIIFQAIKEKNTEELMKEFAKFLVPEWLEKESSQP